MTSVTLTTPPNPAHDHYSRAKATLAARQLKQSCDQDVMRYATQSAEMALVAAYTQGYRQALVDHGISVRPEGVKKVVEVVDMHRAQDEQTAVEAEA